MKYKLLKDIPWYKAWQIFLEDALEERTFSITTSTSWWKCLVNKDYAEKYPEFFEPIKEEREIKYPDNLMEWWIVHFAHPYEAWELDREEIEGEYITWNRFATKEKAEAFIALKKDVARFPKINIWERHHKFSVKLWRREIRRNEWNTIDYVIQDFTLPIEATSEEIETREKLLRDYYWF